MRIDGWRNECRWWRGAGTPPNPAGCTGREGGGSVKMDGWMEGCWRDDRGCLNGSTWQLSERGSRVATLCNLLAVPWCMQAWYHSRPGKHTLEWGSSEERRATVFGRTAVLYLFTEKPSFPCYLSDLIPVADLRLPDLATNLKLNYPFNGNAVLMWHLFFVLLCACDKVSAGGLLTWDWSRMPWQLSAIITWEPQIIHAIAQIYTSPLISS